ncbi:hypothetical protein HQ305_05800 [Rhodococcus sp. BP-149]|uniref:hypothetical protein n=1 Tax=unclassified Rhodococcus (in: high G+C Gram-positive bacteria) TaxID=192944 RepID=UPI001C9B4063|nr:MULTISPECIES: hypothetical protein [unclassified Rhodococcus (in: high G+C Gram-positive bacteria)]MBY6684187.1 hypothetical protein [Rhodococcus sp. BP-288]MBY6693152.1 hypothetical protein [Rhodococcus sp. BP-188]MBY6697349.1 hypothetical protein [Rhodococcus sp. BP-285]MBY6702026.1 hypothetical protein [Rhodococcus sp. BP-283]MBY6710041.1 hypothetical protein [Rhodococcus sp. BP-160]
MTRTALALLGGAAAIGAALAAPTLASAGPVPDGVYVGTTPEGAPVPLWDGKTITGDTTVNRLLGVNAIPGDVYRAPSIATGADVVHVDYSRLSPAFGAVFHDEMTRDAVNPNRWNGTVYFVGAGQPVVVGGFAITR